MNILAIGGSDPSSGAGIQSDIKAASALGANCFSVITAITAQNSQRFTFVESVSARSLGEQIDSVFSDFDIDVITIGMVYEYDVIKKIHSKLKEKKIPIILDPVIKSTTGGVLLKKSAISALKKFLIPISHTITPNVAEAETLSGIKIRKYDDLAKAASSLAKLGAKNIIITGHQFGKGVSDFVYDGKSCHSISGKKIPGQNHGSGCNFAISLAYSIAQKNKLDDAVRFAKQFTSDAMVSSKKLGHGLKITHPKQDKIKSELLSSITQFESLENVHSLIPECQTNFVFARPNSKSTGDIVGVLGRIVKAGNAVKIAGSLEYGASRHVASAVLVMQKKFPQTRAALNIRYNMDLVKKFAKNKSVIASYDRADEPKSNKDKENSSISWGIRQAIKKTSSPPDIIYHKGDFGKEPMIIVFGNNPSQVVDKVSKIL